ncbi:MAG: hypothetical protein KDI06_03430 [Calditrichaeota bacterium]|nr:hypothetical protein [Calditrichota bacterium]
MRVFVSSGVPPQMREELFSNILGTLARRSRGEHGPPDPGWIDFEGLEFYILKAAWLQARGFRRDKYRASKKRTDHDVNWEEFEELGMLSSALNPDQKEELFNGTIGPREYPGIQDFLHEILEKMPPRFRLIWDLRSRRKKYHEMFDDLYGKPGFENFSPERAVFAATLRKTFTRSFALMRSIILVECLNRLCRNLRHYRHTTVLDVLDEIPHAEYVTSDLPILFREQYLFAQFRTPRSPALLQKLEGLPAARMDLLHDHFRDLRSYDDLALRHLKEGGQSNPEPHQLAATAVTYFNDISQILIPRWGGN